MNELVKATGVPKSTILHYLHQGLLPDPIKTSRNMSYYDRKCVGLIELIQALQRLHRLSLAEIKAIIDKRGYDFDYSTQVELNHLVFQSSPSIDTKSFCEQSGLSPEQLEELVQERLINPLKTGHYDSLDLAMGKAFCEAFSWGMKAEDFAYYVELGEKIIDHEVSLRSKTTKKLSDQEDTLITLKMVKNARLTRVYVLERLFQHRVASIKDIKE